MKFTTVILTLATLGTAGCTPQTTSMPPASAETPRVSSELTRQELFTAFKKAPEVELCSIDPGRRPLPPGEEASPQEAAQFMDYKLLGSASLASKDAANLISSFEKGITEKTDTLEAGCFNPHHGLRAKLGGHSYSAIICYECLQVYAMRDDEQYRLKMLTTATPGAVFDEALKSHNLPTSK